MFKLRFVIPVTLLIMSLIVLSFSFFYPGKESYEIANTPPSLRELKKINELHIYRYIVSDEKNWHVDSKGNVDQNGDEKVRYVSIATVDAIIPMVKVKLDYNSDNNLLTIDIPEIQIKNGVILEDLSFIWKGKVNVDISQIAKVTQRRVSIRAMNLGIMKKAQANSKKFFKAFFNNLGYSNVKVQFSL